MLHLLLTEQACVLHYNIIIEQKTFNLYRASILRSLVPTLAK